MWTQITSFLKLARLHFLLGWGIFYLVGALMARYQSGRLDGRILVWGLATMWLQSDWQRNHRVLVSRCEPVGNDADEGLRAFCGRLNITIQTRRKPRQRLISHFPIFRAATAR